MFISDVDEVVGTKRFPDPSPTKFNHINIRTTTLPNERVNSDHVLSLKDQTR
ncbi:hypothetical protein HanRHA438_Chr05g0230131 [Helianthus annuus]|nr:hypothetical protein HanRHA438_Chr05g0230131 [Helianthus annuus]